MAQRQFLTSDTSSWSDRFGTGSDGAYAPSTGTDAPIDSAATGTSGTTSLAATNASFTPGQLILIHQTQGTGVGVWELNKIASYSAGTITTSYTLINTYGTGAQVLVMPSYSSGSIAGGVTLTGKAWNGTVGGIYTKLCNGTFTIAGTLTLSQKGFRGARQNRSSGQSEQGEGTVGLGGNAQSANGNGGGGDADFQNAAGGGGGNGAAGTAGTGGAGGTGGSAVGIASLVTANLGGGGGMAFDASFCPVPGSGGGFILIIAKTLIVSGGVVDNGGTGGTTGATASGSSAGGSILFKGQTLTLGSSLITATGGATVSNTQSGGAGGTGRIHADYSKTISGTTSPTINSTQDSILNDIGGGAFLYNLL